MRNKKKLLLNVLFFMSLIMLTYYIIFKDYSMKTILDSLKNLNYYYLFLAILFMLINFLIEALNIKLLLNSFNEKINLFKSFIYTIICFLFSAITPGGSGGQPIVIYYLSKENIKVSNSTLSYLVFLLGYNVCSLILGLVVAILNPSIFDSQLSPLFIIGSLFILVPISITLIGIFSKGLLVKILNIIVKVLKIIRIKNVDKIQERINDELKVFNNSSKYVKTHRSAFAKSFVLSIIQIFFNYSVPFFIFKAFGLSGYSLLFIIELQAILHNTSACIPLPGAVGITETAFLMIFSIIYPLHLIHGSLIVNRIISFYSFVVLGLLLFIFYRIFTKKQNN